jgi:MYXO-CTERM domain-containing protein
MHTVSSVVTRCAPRHVARAALAATLLMVAAVRPAHAQPNLVANGGFEGGGSGGIPAGWYNANPGGSNAGLTSASRTGSWGAYFSSFGPSGFTTPLGFSALGQTLATTAGQAYTITFWARNNSTADVVNRFQLLFGGATLFDQMLTNMAYQQFTVTGIAAGATTELVFRGYNRTSQNVLDDVSVVAVDTPPPTVVPEPSTMVLAAAGLAALGAAARRRPVA